jgi:hypothetical protein
MPVASPYLVELDRYERTVHGWIDAPEAAAFRTTVRLSDPWVGVELVTETTPSPEYAIRAARARILVGPTARVDPALGDAMRGLAGLTMTAGFTRRVAEVTGGRAGGAYFVDAAIEGARLARQVTRLPADVIARHLPEGPIGAWRLDMQGWVGLPSSCYTYRPESERLFAERRVTSPMLPVLYNPPAGASGVFNRTKVARLERRGAQIALSHAMFDEVHSFQIWYVIDGDGTVVEAGSHTPRLPYGGICSDAQERIGEMRGQRLDAGLRKRLGGLVGGTAGCAQLYDLTVDLLKLLTLP